MRSILSGYAEVSTKYVSICEIIRYFKKYFCDNQLGRDQNYAGRNIFLARIWRIKSLDCV